MMDTIDTNQTEAALICFKLNLPTCCLSSKTNCTPKNAQIVISFLDGLDDEPYSMNGVVVLLQNPKGQGDDLFLPHFF